MPHQVPLQPGDPRRVGRYRLAGRIIGIPAEGPIYLGESPDGTEVSISVLRDDWTRNGAARDRFAAEAAVAKRVPPFCAARILDAGLDGDSAYLISEYIPGRSLLEVISTEGILSAADLEAAAIGMATGLASIHYAGLVHGHFGPEYVIMTAAGPRVVEFGITPPYGAATPSADMAAWAQTVVFAAAGKPPATVGDLDVLPDDLRTVVIECLHADPAERPAARSAVLELIGDDEIPAGVLAEGSRRAVPGLDLQAWPPQPAQPVGSGGPWPQASEWDPAQGASALLDPAQRGVMPAGTRTPRGGQPGAGRPAARHAPGGRQAEMRHVAAPAARRQSADRGSGPLPAVSRHGHPAEDAQWAAARAGGSAADRHNPRHQPARRRPTRWIIAGVLCALVLLGVVLILNLGSGPQASNHPRILDPSSAKPSPKPSASLAPTARTPASFAGDWSGQVRQPPTDIYSVTVSLTNGSSAGTVSYSGTDLGCSGALTLMTATSHKLTLHQGTLKGQSTCNGGTVTITRTGASTVLFVFSGGGPTAEGTLIKS